MFTFAAGQKPWDRMVSYYHWLRETKVRSSGSGAGQSLEVRPAFVQSPTVQRVVFAASLYGSYLRERCGVRSSNLFVRTRAFLADGASQFSINRGFDLTLPGENTSDRAAGYKGIIPQRHADRNLLAACAEISTRFGYRSTG